MKRQTIATLVLLATALSIMSIGVASADTIYVPDNYETIQSAVANANIDDIIIVQDGTYTENVDVNKRLTIRSEHGAASTIVQAANSSDHVFEVTVGSTNISGFRIAGATDSAGIFLDGVDYCNIANNNASGNKYGIRLWFSNYNTFMNNIANSNTGYGFDLLNSNHNTLQNNTAKQNAGNSWSCGICIYRNFDLADHNTIVNNTVNSNGGYGGILLYNADNSYIAGNTINSNTYGIYVRSYYGLFTTSPGSSDHNTITDNNIIDNSIGVVMASLTDCGVEHRTEHNTIYNNYFANPENINFTGPVYENIWNTANTTGPNIVGGPFIGGNYWSDYEGEDTDGDGFGEASHNIADGGLNQDHLPLVLPMCGDITGDGNIDTVDLLLLLEHVVTGMPVDACVGDIDGNGRINVLDARLLMGYIANPTGYSLNCGC